MKDIFWVFDSPDMVKVSPDSTKTDIEKQFVFRLTRYKDAETHEESLKIESLLNGQPNGFIVTTIYSLDSDIKELMKFGVVLSALQFRELRIVIEKNYLSLAVTPIEFESDTRLKDFLALAKEFVEGDKKLITEDFCYIRVNDFNGLAEDSGYSSYEIRALRSALASQKYIRTMGNRNAIIVRLHDKPERVIAFYREKLEVAAPVKGDDK